MNWNDDEDDEDIEGYEVKDGIGIIPDGTTAIKSEAFKGSEDLISINIPKGVTRIDESAFEDCINLASITIPDSVRSIGEEMCYCCENLKSIKVPAGKGDYFKELLDDTKLAKLVVEI